MSSARHSAIRLLQLMMVASVVLPAVLFVFASWLSYRHEQSVADDRIERSLDIVHEHALKVFQTGERAIAEVDSRRSSLLIAPARFWCRPRCRRRRLPRT